ncbi:MAG: spermidine synthase [Ornithinimicrobium sp.]|uniref:spermidine synthase n=1 Tax=Ornithinimicrobium sp. TaxID=1977084 RepID=UPI003D9B7077
MTVEVQRDERGGFVVLRDGHPQSYVDLDDPQLLVFDYVQHLALALDTLPPGRLAVTHVGGAGLTLPRWVEHTRPGSPQIVLEPDEELTALVRRELPLPRRHRIRVRPVDGLSGLSELRDDSADVVVIDAFDAGRVPADLTGTDMAQQVHRALRTSGLLLVNLADEPGLRHAARVVATVRTALPHVALIGATEVVKGRRFGNVVLVAGQQPLDAAELSRRVARSDFPTTFWGSARTARWAAGSAPFPGVGEFSPPPPDPGAWRRR